MACRLLSPVIPLPLMRPPMVRHQLKAGSAVRRLFGVWLSASAMGWGEEYLPGRGIGLGYPARTKFGPTGPEAAACYSSAATESVSPRSLHQSPDVHLNGKGEQNRLHRVLLPPPR
jgi:hypothetical protein